MTYNYQMFSSVPGVLSGGIFLLLVSCGHDHSSSPQPSEAKSTHRSREIIGQQEGFGFLHYDDATPDDNRPGVVLIQRGVYPPRLTSIIATTDGKLVLVGPNDEAAVVARFLTEGTVDTSFNGRGFSLFYAPDTYESATSAVLQTDGKVVVGAGQNDFAVLRLLTDGTLDTAFGTTGKVSLIIPASNEKVEATLLQSDGRILVAGGTSDFIVARYVSNGSLDTSFHTDGIASADISGGSEDRANAALLQTDGNIVVMGTLDKVPIGVNVAIARFLTNGVLDTTFNRGGLVWTVVPGNPTSAFDSILQTNAKLVAVGTTDDGGGNYQFLLVQYLSNGLLDTSFHSDGRVTTQLIAGYDYTFAGILQTDGKIIAMGGSANFELARYLTDGTLDTTFSSNGMETSVTPYGGDVAYAGLLLEDGRFLAVGDSNRLHRYSTDGTLDTSFFSNGRLAFTLAFYSTIKSLEYQNGSLFALGRDYEFDAFGFQISKFRDNGAFDTAFNTNGSSYADPSGIYENPKSMSLQTDGKVVAVGYGIQANYYDFAMVRLLTNGQLDTSFNSNGFVIQDLGGSYDYVSKIIQQTDGKLLAMGVGVTGGGDSDFLILRYLSSGVLDTSFDSDGRVFTSISGGDFCNSATIQTDGKIVSLGTSSDGDLEATRHNSDGTLDTTFDNDGKLNKAQGPNTSVDVAMLQEDGKIIGAGTTNEDFLIVRYLTNGALDTSFHSDGIATLNISGADYGRGAALQNDGKIFMVGNDGSLRGRWAVARFLTNGTLDTTFRTGGLLLGSVQGYGATLFSALIDPKSGQLYVGGEAFTHLGQQGMLMRIAP